MGQFLIATSSHGDGYVDIAVSPPSTSPYSFRFSYKRPSSLEYRFDADISCAEAVSISGPVVSVDSGPCTVRWRMSSNGVSKSERVSISISPMPSIAVSYSAGDHSTVAAVTSAGIRSSFSASGRKYGENISVSGSFLYWDGNPVYTSSSGIMYADSASVAGLTRIFITESDGTIVDIFSDGTPVYASSTGASPVHCSYDPASGNLAITYDDAMRVDIVEWLDPEDGAMRLYPGNILYSTAPGTLSAPRACTFTSSTRICVADSTKVEIYDFDSGNAPISTMDEVVYASPMYSSSPHVMTLSGVSWAVECDGMIAIVTDGMIPVPYSGDRTLHETFRRSLGPAASGRHPSLSNCIFRPVPTRSPMSVGILNSDELRRSAERDSLSFGSSFVAAYGRFSPRGRIGADIPVVGVMDGYVYGGAQQTFTAMTGQKLVFSDALPDTSYGYTVDSGVMTPVKVSFSTDVYVRDLFTGDRDRVGTVGSSDLEYRLPDASPDSYARSSTYGVHGAYAVEFVTTETRGGADYVSMSSVIVVSLWWRHILKEAVSDLSPVSSYVFDLEDYSGTTAAFFDSWTVFPSYYAVSGSEPTDAQKEALVLESAFALSSFAVPVCPGDSPASVTYGLKPEGVSVLPGPQRKSPMYGLSAAFQATNIFQDRPASFPAISQFISDTPFAIFVMQDGSCLASPNGGVEPIPAYGNFIYAFLSSPQDGVSTTLVLDEPSFTVADVSFYGNNAKTRPPGSGDTSFIVSFSDPSPSPERISVSVSVDGGTWTSFMDESGTVREYKFQSSSVLGPSSVIRYRLSMYGASGEYSEHVARYSVADAWGGIAVSNVRIYDDRKAKAVHVVYDLDSSCSYMPVDVSFSFTVEGQTLHGFTGDVGVVYAGPSRRATFSYYSFTRSMLYSRSVISVSAVSVMPVSGTGDFPFFLRGSRMVERPFSLQAFAVPAVVEDQPLRTFEETIEDVKSVSIEQRAVMRRSRPPYESSSSSSGKGFPDVFDGGMTGLPIVQTYWKLDAMETGDPADVSFDGGLVS